MSSRRDHRRVLVELTPKTYAQSRELMVEPMRELYQPMAERYTRSSSV